MRARGIAVDQDGFTFAMEKQRAEARASWAGSGEAANEAQWFAVLDEVGRTEFLGYDTEEAEGEILAIFKDGERVKSADRRRDRADPHQPDAFLCRIRRPGGRQRPDAVAPRRKARSPTPRKSWAPCMSMWSR